jgi:hypothetical protein
MALTFLETSARADRSALAEAGPGWRSMGFSETAVSVISKRDESSSRTWNSRTSSVSPDATRVDWMLNTH